MGVSVQLEVSQPFEICCRKSASGSARRIDNGEIKAFWATTVSAFSMKQGCYVFALEMRSGKYMPWYVGKTKKQTFQKECFGHFQLGKYNRALFEHKGKPVMWFVAPQGNKNVLPKQVIKEMERFLIRQGRYENPEILNKANAGLPQWGIKGVLRKGKGKPSSDEKAFSRMMGID